MQTVKVRLRKPNRVFNFLSNNIPLNRDDPCVVRSDRGLEYGVCILPPEEISAEEQKRYKMNVIRKATHHDQTTHTQILYDEDMAKKNCAEKIRARELAMKLVEAEYTFDRRKIIFYFTAEDRVDFRELVRELAADLKARIELRHIQVRDEAKMVGGIGTCGRELCCTSWMREFMPISMKMAKRQNLSLNPTKISGQCGRLMCCLSYENELYGKAKRQGGLKPDAGPERRARIQDKMKENPEEAAKALKRSSLKDVPEKDGDAPQRPRRRRERRRPDADGGAKRPDRKIDAPAAKESDGNRREKPDRPPRRERSESRPPRERKPKQDVTPKQQEESKAVAPPEPAETPRLKPTPEPTPPAAGKTQQSAAPEQPKKESAPARNESAESESNSSKRRRRHKKRRGGKKGEDS